MINKLLMWFPFIGLLLFLMDNPIAEKFICERSKDLRGFFCIVIWHPSCIIFTLTFVITLSFM